MMIIDTAASPETDRMDAVRFSPIVASGKKRKSVSFFPRVAVRNVLHRRDYTAEEFGNAWYTMDQLKRMKHQCRVLAVRLSRTSNDENSLRGLEGRTPEGVMKRNQIKGLARNAVLMEQSRQRRWGFVDSQLIAEAYFEFSVDSKCHAYTVALKDQKEAMQYHDTSPKPIAQGIEVDLRRRSMMSYSRSDSLKSISSLISMSSSTRRLLADVIFKV